jgi:hypothetical protein
LKQIAKKNINAKCGGRLKVSIHKLRNPRLVILNIPEDISTGNLEDTLIAQNPDLDLKKETLKPNSAMKQRNIRNLVMEIGAQTRKQLLQKKVKLGSLICKIEDHVVANRCFKCSRFNHRFRDCRGEKNCPLRRKAQDEGLHSIPNGIQMYQLPNVQQTQP